MLADLKTAQKVTGAKQVTRALKNGTARRVFLAQDADPRVTEPIAALCREQGTETESVDTMAALGSACGIAVGSAVSVAADDRVDSRVLYSAGKAAQLMQYEDFDVVWLAIPIAAYGKSPFFDRKPKK